MSRMKETHFVAVHEFMFLAMLLSDVTLGIFGLERTLLCFRAKRNYNKKSARNCKAPILMFYRGTFCYALLHLKPYSSQNAPLLTLFVREEISRLSNSGNKRQNTKRFLAACKLIQTLLITRALGGSCIQPPTMNFLFSAFATCGGS